MIKGICKEFVSVRIKNNPLYDEAIFILKHPYKKTKKSKQDIIFEANRILCEQGVKKPKRRSKILKKIVFSASFSIFGAIIGALVMFFIVK